MSLYLTVFIPIHLVPKGNLESTTEGNKQTNTNQSCKQITIKNNLKNNNNDNDKKSV